MLNITTRLLTMCLVLAIPGLVAAGTILVPEDYTSIQEAIDIASTNDTIVVGPGVHRATSLDFQGKEIVLTSAHGPTLTSLRPSASGQSIIRLQSNEPNSAIIEGFTFSHAGGAEDYPYVYQAIWLDNAAPTIRNNIFTNCGSGGVDETIVFARRNSPAIVTRNMFYNNPDISRNIWIATSAGMTVTNNSIHSGDQGIRVTGDAFVVKNNTVSDCATNYTVIGTGTFDYNNDWQSTKANISVDPMFVDAAAGNFELLPGSGLIDQGDPTIPDIDPDGTGNDIGALPFDQRRASVYNLNVGEEAAHVTATTPTLYWSFYDSSQTQDMIQIEAGTDKDWSVAELWQPSAFLTSDTEMVYTGAALSPNDIVYWRVRANNGSTWGEWKQHVFRIHETPAAPTPVAPADGGSASVAGTRLVVMNSTSSFGDDLTYDFELYADAGLTSLVVADSGVAEIPAKTHSQLITTLVAGNSYWWRVRAFDGYVHSDWSAASMFEARQPVTVLVPTEHPTIQAGIDQAMALDTVVVADGVYTGDGNRDLHLNGLKIVVRSENGPSTTTIDCGSDTDGPHGCLTVNSSEDTGSVLQGFTITNGQNENNPYFGVVTVREGGLMLRDCVFEDNLDPGLSAIAAIYDSLPEVMVFNCTFRNNDRYGAYLAGVNATIDSSRFEENIGRGIDAADWEHLKITNNLFLRNQTDGLYLWTGGPTTVTVASNTFVGNDVGLHFYWVPPKSDDLSSQDDGITQNIAAYNTTHGIWGDGLGFATSVTCNDAYGNGDEDFVGWEIGPGDGYGNISSPPQFCNAAADNYAIAASSPCAPANNSCGVLMGAIAVDPLCTGACCSGETGNVNLDPADEINLTDLTVLINSLFVTMEPLLCLAEANISGDAGCEVNLTDVTILVNHLFVTFEEPAPCNPNCE